MKLSRTIKRGRFLRLLLFTVVASTLYWHIQHLRATNRSESFQAVSVTGVHHMGDKFNVAQFYVDGYDGSNVGREGGGGRSVCCVMLPKAWRPGLSAEVRWSVGDWSKENRNEIEAGNFRSVDGAGANYIANVTVEQYNEAAHLWVHFFSDGRVRVVSSGPGSGGPEHPIQDNDPHAVEKATVGRQVDALFSQAELAKMDRKDNERKKKYGDWR